MKRILLIDDDPGVMSLLKKPLEAAGYRVDMSGNGAEGLESARLQRPDIVLVDVVMPKMDGFSFVREMRSDDALKKTPIIVITAKTDLDDLFRAEGVEAFLKKPISIEEVLGRVEMLIGRS
ncbi:MAG: response regulator [Elusimicrobia bacterium]|nr:response regulator [Elusimicrobiota bacterium]